MLSLSCTVMFNEQRLDLFFLNADVILQPLCIYTISRLYIAVHLKTVLHTARQYRTPMSYAVSFGGTLKTNDHGIYASVNCATIGSDNGLSPVHRQAFIGPMLTDTLRTTLQWSNQNRKAFFQENEFENIVREIATISARPLCVKRHVWKPPKF